MSNSGKIWDTREAYKKQRGNQWIEPGNIGLYGGNNPEANTVEQINISTNGNATDFGDLTESVKKTAAAGALTRTVRCGGTTPSDVNTMDFANPFNAGNFVNFGDLGRTGQTTNTCHSNNVRGIAGAQASSNDTLDVFTIASQGNGAAFGDVTQNDLVWTCGGGNNTRYFSAGAYPASNIICVKSIANSADCVDFGDLSASKWGVSQSSDPTRICFAGGSEPGLSTDIEFITIATAGNATDFGDLTAATGDASACSNSVRSAIQGQQSPSNANNLDVFTIQTTGNATDFGDTLTTFHQCFGVSNGHGGIPQTDQFPQRPSVNYMPGSGRALYSGGQIAPSDALTTNVNMIHIPTTGNTSAFGDLATAASNGPGNGASNTRSIVYSGYSPASPYYDNTIQATTFSSLGNYFDFGDPTQQRYAISYGNIGSPTRAVFMGGYAPGSPYYVNIIDYITIATVGNGTDFGDLAAATNNVAGCSSSTRGIGMGGYTGSQDDTIQYVTIASTGNATDFGNLAAAKSGAGGLSSSTRGIIGGGKAPSAINVIEYITIASTGNATDFGDLTEARNSIATASNSNRGVFMGGSTPTKVDKMDYITIASTGNATDFGDTKVDVREGAGTSDSHGGLQA